MGRRGRELDRNGSIRTHRGSGVILALVVLSIVVVLPLGASSTEEQVRQLAAELRCPVCQGLSVADSPSKMANQMRDSQVRYYAPSVQMATVAVTTLPILCVYPFLQKHFTKGIILGAIKA